MSEMGIDCLIVTPVYKNSVMIPNILIEVITIIFCGILVWKVCSLNAQNDKELQISKKKTVSKLVIYIVTVPIGIAIKTTILILPLATLASNIWKVILLLYFLFVNYIFLWTKQFQETFIDVYCCRNKQTFEETQNNNQKELIFQQNLDEEQPSNFDDNEYNE
jgi:hypothetical protein